MVEARKEDPGADTDRAPGGKNGAKLFILNKGAPKPELHKTETWTAKSKR